MGNVTKNIILDKNGVKLPFSKEKLSIAPTFYDPCESKDFKGVADIPDEYLRFLLKIILNLQLIYINYKEFQ